MSKELPTLTITYTENGKTEVLNLKPIDERSEQKQAEMQRIMILHQYACEEFIKRERKNENRN